MTGVAKTTILRLIREVGTACARFHEAQVRGSEEVKTYTNSPQPGMSPNAAASRYSPGRVKFVTRIPRIGMPVETNISTSCMERWNLTLRMQNRRFTRLIHRHMIAMTVVFYNFCKSHKSLGGRTPAQVAGLTDYVWTVRDLLALDMWALDAAA